MQKKCSKGKNLLSFILCSVLIVAMALYMAGCSGASAGKDNGAKSSSESSIDNEQPEDQAGTDDSGQPDSSTGSNGSTKLDEETDLDGSEQPDSSAEPDENDQPEDSEGSQTDAQGKSDGGVLGEGSTRFSFAAVDAEGSRTQWEIHTDKKTVGEALLELGLIDGDEGEFGLYVKTVNGVTLDYDKDGMYWAFYVNDEYAQSGVDSTEIKDGDTYLLKAEKS